MGTRQGNIIDGFNLVAPAYDVATDILTLGFHRVWRDYFCKFFLKNTPKNSNILDIATGTGEILFRSVRKRPDLHAYGVDLSQGMLIAANAKLKKRPFYSKNKIDFRLGNALQLPFENNYFEVATICWSIRNLRPIQSVLREALRVLKPGGNLYILEHGLPELKVMRSFFNKYAPVIPVLGEKITHSKPVYPLYTTSADGFASGKHFAAELYEAGFTKVQYETFSGGVIYIYSAKKCLNSI
jgi:demethylmenaquinone methyltransferase/2-methoxy-6-polyprenyl-1,4-benzoquinol methylase